MKKPELLAPAGSYEKAVTAFRYGADAIYVGTSKLSLRSRVDIDDKELERIVKYAHSINKKVYVALNIYARDDMYEDIEKQLKILSKIEPDGLIISDGGILAKAKKIAPNLSIHISTQANIVSYHTSNFWYENGAKRVILARELNKKEIKKIMENKNNKLEIEIFIHGAICYAYSGRCHLSDFLASRSANLGDCAQSCRWEYNLFAEEKNNPGNMMPIEQDGNGTYIFSSKDLCLIKELSEIINLNINSLKIEGRLKTEYYLASIINIYRVAIDEIFENINNKKYKYDYKKYLKEIEKVKTRGLSRFFFDNKENKDFQEYDGKQYNLEYEFGGKVLEYNKEKSIIEIRNRLQLGDDLEVIIPNEIKPYKFKIKKLFDIDTKEEIEFVNPGKEDQKVYLNIPIEVENGYILRRKKTNINNNK